MNISGIRPLQGFYENNTVGSVQEVVAAHKQQMQEMSVEGTDETENESARKKQTFGSYEYANTYKPNETHQLKGADSDLSSLDVSKAVSSMKVDSVIQQYQFFVKGVADRSNATSFVEDFAL